MFILFQIKQRFLTANWKKTSTQKMDKRFICKSYIALMLPEIIFNWFIKSCLKIAVIFMMIFILPTKSLWIKNKYEIFDSALQQIQKKKSPNTE